PTSRLWRFAGFPSLRSGCLDFYPGVVTAPELFTLPEARALSPRLKGRTVPKSAVGSRPRGRLFLGLQVRHQVSLSRYQVNVSRSPSSKVTRCVNPSSCSILAQSMA